MILQLDNLIRDGLSPRINCHLKLLTEKNILIIEIKKSWNKPHRVIYKGHDKFYSRNSGGKYPLDVDELRIAFTSTDSIVERIRKFINNRINNIFQNEGLLPLYDKGKIVLLIIPFDSMNPESNFNVLDLKVHLKPIYSSGWNPIINLEGILSYSPSHNNNKSYSYVQLYRNGIIECVNSSLLMGFNPNDLSIPSKAYESEIITSFSDYIKVYDEIGISSPFILSLSFVDVKGYSFITDRFRFPTHHNNLNEKDIIKIPEIMIQDLNRKVEYILKPVFDMVWNNFGYRKSFNYDDKNWVGK